LDLLADGVVLAVGAVQVDLMQDAGAGPGPGGDLGGRAGGVEPQGQGGVPQVIGAAGERGGGQAGAEGGLAGTAPPGHWRTGGMPWGGPLPVSGRSVRSVKGRPACI
jgi:hypothetical protein